MSEICLSIICVKGVQDTAIGDCRLTDMEATNCTVPIHCTSTFQHHKGMCQAGLYVRVDNLNVVTSVSRKYMCHIEPQRPSHLWLQQCNCTRAKRTHGKNLLANKNIDKGPQGILDSRVYPTCTGLLHTSACCCCHSRALVWPGKPADTTMRHSRADMHERKHPLRSVSMWYTVEGPQSKACTGRHTCKGLLV